MVKKYSIAEARDNFTSMVHEAEEGARVELTRRGKPVAVLIGVEDFERLSTPNKKKGFWEAYQEFRRTHDLVAADIDPDEIWGDIRDHSPSSGRDFE